MTRRFPISLLLVACAAEQATPSGDEYAATAHGVVRGTRDGDAIAWLGIPYAAPPVHELRWRDPQPPRHPR